MKVYQVLAVSGDSLEVVATYSTRAVAKQMRDWLKAQQERRPKPVNGDYSLAHSAAFRLWRDERAARFKHAYLKEYAFNVDAVDVLTKTSFPDIAP